MMLSREDDRERGATLVEAAFVLPLLLLFVFGLIDLGYGAFQTSQASSAARDAARVAILDPPDDSGPVEMTPIQDAAEARIPGRDDVLVTVTCYAEGSNEDDPDIDCAIARPNVDFVKVDVVWTYEPPTFVGGMTGIKQIRGSSSKTIIGPRITVTQPPPPPEPEPDPEPPPVPGSCQIESVSASPMPVKLANGKGKEQDLAKATTFTVTTNGEATCSGLKIVYSTVDGAVTVPLSNVSPPLTFKDDVSETEYNWVAGTSPLKILDSSNNELDSFDLVIS